MCLRSLQHTFFNSIPTLVHPPVLQLREYPLKPVSLTLCYFYLRSISPLLLFSSPFYSFPPHVSLCLFTPHLTCVCVAWCRTGQGQGWVDRLRHGQSTRSARRLAMHAMHTVSVKRSHSCPHYRVSLCFLVFLVRCMDFFNAFEIHSTGVASASEGAVR